MSVTFIKWPLVSHDIVAEAYLREVGERLIDAERHPLLGIAGSPKPTFQNRLNLKNELGALIDFYDAPPAEWGES